VAAKDLQVPACDTLFCTNRQKAAIIDESARKQPKQGNLGALQL
jgi:hypothetical protein